MACVRCVMGLIASGVLALSVLSAQVKPVAKRATTPFKSCGKPRSRAFCLVCCRPQVLLPARPPATSCSPVWSPARTKPFPALDCPARWLLLSNPFALAVFSFTNKTQPCCAAPLLRGTPYCFLRPSPIDQLTYIIVPFPQLK